MREDDEICPLVDDNFLGYEGQSKEETQNTPLFQESEQVVIYILVLNQLRG